MIIVTGAAGFIGSNLLLELNNSGHQRIIAVDDLTDGKKYRNLAASRFHDYMDYRDFLTAFENGAYPDTQVIFHQGACSATTEWDGRYMMECNYEYSKALLQCAQARSIPFIYASSAAVYGKNTHFSEAATQQMPLNVYGYSKWLFDQYVLRHLPEATAQVIGLRYFNVYGPHEQHKGSMASVMFHFMNQLRDNGVLRLFEGVDGCADGEQKRDFVFVKDVVEMNIDCWQKAIPSGIYNCGTGQAETFNAVAETLIRAHGSGEIEYIPFPDHLQGTYQSYTCADLSLLQAAGYQRDWSSLQAGIEAYYRAHMTD